MHSVFLWTGYYQNATVEPRWSYSWTSVACLFTDPSAQGRFERPVTTGSKKGASGIALALILRYFPDSSISWFACVASRSLPSCTGPRCTCFFWTQCPPSSIVNPSCFSFFRKSASCLSYFGLPFFSCPPFADLEFALVFLFFPLLRLPFFLTVLRRPSCSFLSCACPSNLELCPNCPRLLWWSEWRPYAGSSVAPVKCLLHPLFPRPAVLQRSASSRLRLLDQKRRLSQLVCSKRFLMLTWLILCPTSMHSRLSRMKRPKLLFSRSWRS